MGEMPPLTLATANEGLVRSALAGVPDALV